jgi:hypothetical protein
MLTGTPGQTSYSYSNFGEQAWFWVYKLLLLLLLLLLHISFLLHVVCMWLASIRFGEQINMSLPTGSPGQTAYSYSNSSGQHTTLLLLRRLLLLLQLLLLLLLLRQLLLYSICCCNVHVTGRFTEVQNSVVGVPFKTKTKRCCCCCC